MLLMEMNSKERTHSHFQPRGLTYNGQEHMCKECECLLLQAGGANDRRLPSHSSGQKPTPQTAKATVLEETNLQSRHQNQHFQRQLRTQTSLISEFLEDKDHYIKVAFTVPTCHLQKSPLSRTLCPASSSLTNSLQRPFDIRSCWLNGQMNEFSYLVIFRYPETNFEML